VAKRHVKLGEMLYKNKQYPKAVEHARIAIEKLPQYAPGHVLLGRALVAQGRCDEAAPAFDTALRLDPRSAAAAEGQKGCQGKK